tara:strand:- start:32 stop:520 length:489 start_codon:yes stop_codon:yes gene_type:complete
MTDSDQTLQRIEDILLKMNNEKLLNTNYNKKILNQLRQIKKSFQRLEGQSQSREVEFRSAIYNPGGQTMYCPECNTYECDENGNYLYYYANDQGPEHTGASTTWPSAGVDSNGRPMYTTTKEDGCYDGDYAWPRILKTQYDGFVLPNKTNRLMSTHRKLRFN